MFSELKDDYEKKINNKLEFNEKKEIQQAYLRKCQINILEGARDISCLLKDSIVENFSCDKNGVYITLNRNFGNLKLYIHETDLDSAPMWLTCFGSYEKNETEIVRKLVNMLPDDAVIFDIGANVGWYSLMLTKCFKGVKVYSFEPAPENFVRLQRNFQLNGLDNKGLINKGLYNTQGEIDFHFNPERTGASSIRDILGKNLATIKVDMDTMDNWVKTNNISNLHFIKCDVEGAELFVYQGGIEAIKKYKPIVFSEMLRKWASKYNYHPNDIIKLFSDIGYKCFVINKNNMLKELEYVDEETVETNYFFLHSEVHSQIINDLCITEY